MKPALILMAAAWLLLTACGGQQTTEQKTETGTETVTAPVVDTPAAPTATPFTKEIAYDNIRFTVNSPGSASANSFTITPSGLSVTNEGMSENIQGQVVDVKVNDMDGDNSPEVAVIVEESPGGKRKAHVYSSFARKSFGMVNFVDVTDETKLTGYQGGDEYEFIENTFIRRFPIYEGGQKTGKTRQFQFKMKRGEAMKQLVLDKSLDF
jgi:hypothetical protein